MTAPAIQSSAPRRAAPPSDDAPRVVLFGMSESGKTSLLGALARVSEIQERVLGARIEDVSQGLRELRGQVYDQHHGDKQGEIASYAVRLLPLLNEQADGATPADLVLIDCDGRSAAELLGRADILSRPKPGSLAHQILGADAVLLL